MRYAGRVYDGPLEGEHRTEDGPYFRFERSPHASVGVFPFNGEPMPSINFYRMLYRWSDPLHAWVFDWNTAPPPLRKRPK